MSINLYDFKEDHYSQNGEDGIIEKLLSTVKVDSGYFVEFGAWDGNRWSNTFYLYEKGWKGCLIEGDKKRFQKLCINIPDDSILKINAFVEESGDNSLDRLLDGHGVKNIDLLSIDVDSDDLRIWEGIRRFDPGIVIVEYNPVIPFDTRFINPKGKTYGNSALSVHESAKDRDYVLVEGTDTNLIFARERIIKDTEIVEKSLQDIKDQTFQLRYFFGHDGTLLHNFDKMNDEGITEIFPVPWSLTFGIQPVPRIFRKYSDNVNYAGVLFFVVFSIFRCPIQLFRLGKLAVKNIFKGRPFPEIIGLLAKKEKLTKALKER